MKMKKIIIPVVAAAFILLTMQNCGKGGGGGSCSEPAMTVVTSPANGSVEPPGVGPDFQVQVNITANKPTSGVTIEVKAHPDGNSTNFFTTSPPISTTSANNTITITGTPSTVSCVVDIVVTSKSCASNKVTLSYKYSKK
jgi:hypothetical protein